MFKLLLCIEESRRAGLCSAGGHHKHISSLAERMQKIKFLKGAGFLKGNIEWVCYTYRFAITPFWAAKPI